MLGFLMLYDVFFDIIFEGMNIDKFLRCKRRKFRLFIAEKINEFLYIFYFYWGIINLSWVEWTLYNDRQRWYI